MTRKDYELIAEIIRVAMYTTNKYNEEQGKSWVEHIALEFSDSLRSTNPRFDRARFLTACGVK